VLRVEAVVWVERLLWIPAFAGMTGWGAGVALLRDVKALFSWSFPRKRESRAEGDAAARVEMPSGLPLSRE
jgi:hypothetical protein